MHLTGRQLDNFKHMIEPIVANSDGADGGKKHLALDFDLQARYRPLQAVTGRCRPLHVSSPVCARAAPDADCPSGAESSFCSRKRQPSCRSTLKRP